MFEHVVSFRQKVQANRLVRVASKSDLLTEGKRAFKPHGQYVLELYYEKFGVYIAVDDLKDMPVTGKLQLQGLTPEPSGPEPSEISESLDPVSKADTVSLRSLGTAPDAGPTLEVPWSFFKSAFELLPCFHDEGWCI